MTKLHSGSHVVFSIHLHIVFVTKYRRKVLTPQMLQDMKHVFERVLSANKSKLSDCNGEADHVHLLIDLHPDNNISDLIASLKSASSRVLREKYKPEIDKYYWGKAKLWHDSKCIVSCGGAPLEIVKKYIQNQSGGRLEKLGASNP
ncbi:IS200/IS605 family transposase [Microseira wollei]|uniref:Transposase n=1 Tax=Microseira wollei NIES-4236 TaxID=2530354 RepID=A0AAV3XAX4_9CYAN|nr:IS200/IS605 family transposase [Microseira wollei]GET36507.1 transposase [Microseira wollei NIES-4236]